MTGATYVVNLLHTQLSLLENGVPHYNNLFGKIYDLIKFLQLVQGPLHKHMMDQNVFCSCQLYQEEPANDVLSARQKRKTTNLISGGMRAN